MTHDLGDDDLKQMFAAMQERDRRSVPALDALLARARTRPVHRIPRAPLLAAAMAVLVVAGAAAALLLRHPAPAVALSSWRSPTAFLLRVPGEDILRTVPSVSASVVRLEVRAGTATEHNE